MATVQIPIKGKYAHGILNALGYSRQDYKALSNVHRRLLFHNYFKENGNELLANKLLDKAAESLSYRSSDSVENGIISRSISDGMFAVLSYFVAIRGHFDKLTKSVTFTACSADVSPNYKITTDWCTPKLDEATIRVKRVKDDKLRVTFENIKFSGDRLDWGGAKLSLADLKRYESIRNGDSITEDYHTFYQTIGDASKIKFPAPEHGINIRPSSIQSPVSMRRELDEMRANLKAATTGKNKTIAKAPVEEIMKMARILEQNAESTLATAEQKWENETYPAGIVSGRRGSDETLGENFPLDFQHEIICQKASPDGRFGVFILKEQTDAEYGAGLQFKISAYKVDASGEVTLVHSGSYWDGKGRQFSIDVVEKNGSLVLKASDRAEIKP